MPTPEGSLPCDGDFAEFGIEKKALRESLNRRPKRYTKRITVTHVLVCSQSFLFTFFGICQDGVYALELVRAEFVLERDADFVHPMPHRAQVLWHRLRNVLVGCKLEGGGERTINKKRIDR